MNGCKYREETYVGDYITMTVKHWEDGERELWIGTDRVQCIPDEAVGELMDFLKGYIEKYRDDKE